MRILLSGLKQPAGLHQLVPCLVDGRRPVMHRADDGVAIGPHPEPGAVAALFAGVAAGGGEGLQRFDRASFEAYLLRQVAAIRDKTGCDEVQFRLATEEGKLKLKARPVGGAQRLRR